MKEYISYFKRLVTFENYPLFRAAHFRYLILNIFIISLLIAVPNIITLVHSVQAASGLSEFDGEIPEFEIAEGEYTGESKTVSLGNNDILFTDQYTTRESEEIGEEVLFGFLKNGIYVRDIQDSGFDYSYISQISNDEDLKTFIDRQISSLYFYVMVYIVFYVSLIMFFTVILMTIANYFPHLLSLLYDKKSRFMSWFKFSTFVTVLMLIPIVAIQISTGSALWWLYLLSLPFYWHYFKKIPRDKRKR